ncbi:MAG: hypothetical protein GX876_10640, partial [Bacteroidales bacterium]|nr:hypothetical protein [Bacteroidales bacterium]
MRTMIFVVITTLMLAAACGDDSGKADAYGNFEATEVIISAETSGRILRFGLTEGSDIEKDEEIALVDTMLFHLQKAEIDAGMRSVSTRMASINAQNDIISQQVANLNVNIARIANMLKNDAATQKQYDDLTGQVAVLQKQAAANNTQKVSVAAELSVF